MKTLPLAAGLWVVLAGTALAQNPPAQTAPKQAEPQKPPQAPPKPPWQDFCCYEKGRIDHGDGTETLIYELTHLPGQGGKEGLEEFDKLLKPYLTEEKGRIEHSNRLSTFSITDTKETVAKIEIILKLIHVADAPVMIEAKVVELRWDNDLQIGVEGDVTGQAAAWVQNVPSDSFLRDIRVRFNPTDALLGAPFQGSTFRFARTSRHQGSIGGLVQMFVERGRAQILSQPRILVRAGKTAKIFTGDEVPSPTNIVLQPAGGTQVTYQYRKAGVSLEVTPQIAAPGQVALKLKPEVSTTFGLIQITPTLTAPQFTVRNVETELVVRDGEEVVIGGLFRRDKTTIRRGLPFLSDIPLLGYLFGKYEDAEIIQEVLFFIKPTILKSREELPREFIIPDK